jgi:flagellar basal body P-ring formation protein FlgA
METKMPFLFAALLAPLPVAGAAFQSTQSLDGLVSQFTGQSIGREGGAQAPVDARLRLASCPAPQLAWRTEAHDAVVVSCMSPNWRIFVPVKSAPRPVAARAVPAVAAAKPEPVIRRGDAVSLEVGAAGFSITRDGVAMGDAPVGGRVPVQVEQGKPPIQAVALEPGRAGLPGWAE